MPPPAKLSFALIGILVTSASLSSPAWATHAHVHGKAKLDVAVDGQILSVHLDSPLESLLGFEHTPNNAAQVQQAREMVAKLRNGSALFALPAAAACQLEQVSIETDALAPSLLDGGTQPPPPPPTGAKKEASKHDDLDADYIFRCAHPSALTGMEIQLFQYFPRLHQLKIQVAGPHGQNAATLSPAKTRLNW